MPKPCSVCSHPDVATINKRILRGDKRTSINDSYNTLTYNMLEKHETRGHLENAAGEYIQKKHPMQGMNLIEDIQQLVSKTENLMDRAEQKGDYSTAMRGIKELRNNKEFLLKVLDKAKDIQAEFNKAERKQNASRLQEGLESLSLPELVTYEALVCKILENDENAILDEPERAVVEHYYDSTRPGVPIDIQLD